MMTGPSSIGKSRCVRGFSLVVIGAVVLLIGCDKGGEKPFTLKGRAQGTTFTITYLDSLQRDLSGAVDSVFREIDHSLSLWDSTSTVTRFNMAKDAFVSDDAHFRVMVSMSHGFWRTTDHAFDPTVLPLVKAWGLGKEGRTALDTSSISALLLNVGIDHITIADNALSHSNPNVPLIYNKRLPGVQFDPNGIAQGYTVDVLAMLLQQQGITNYMVEVGGEARCSGINDRGTVWNMQIDKPIDGPEHVQQTVVPLQDRSLATSGNYRKFIEVDGKRYGHTIDPRTGRPAMNALLSASVIADDCITADALGTALMVMGPDAGKAWLAGHPEVEAYLITDDGTGAFAVWSTPGWPNPR